MTIRKDHNCIHCRIDCRADYNPECYECGKQTTCFSKKGNRINNPTTPVQQTKVANCYIWEPGKQCEFVTDWVCLDQCCAIPPIQIQSIWKRNISGHKPTRKQKRIK